MRGVQEAVLGAVAALALTRNVLADTSRAKNAHVELQWQAPRGCLVAAEVLAEVERLLAGVSPRESGAPLRVAAGVSRSARGAALELELHGVRDGQRELHANNCAELGKAAALVIALAIAPELQRASEPSASGASSVVAQGPTAPAPTCPVHEPSSCPPAPACEAPPPTICAPAVVAPSPATMPLGEAAFRAGPDLRVAIGALPEAWPSPGLSLEYSTPRWLVGLGANLAYARAASADDTRLALFDLWTALAHGCFGGRTGSFNSSLCLGTELGALRAQGFGADRVHTRRSVWVAPTVGARLELPVRRSALVLGLNLAIPLVRTRFELSNQQIFRTNAVVPSLSLSGALALFD